MRLLDHNNWRNPHQAFSVREAVKNECTCELAEGNVESLRADLEKTKEFLGRLVEALANANLIDQVFPGYSVEK